FRRVLFRSITGMDTRIGYPNEHLAGDSDAETTSPMYATAVGLVLNSLESKEKSSLMKRFSHEETVEEVEKETISEQTEEKQKIEKGTEKEKEPKTRIRIFDKWAEKDRKSTRLNSS